MYKQPRYHGLLYSVTYSVYAYAQINIMAPFWIVLILAHHLKPILKSTLSVLANFPQNPMCQWGTVYKAFPDNEENAQLLTTI